jgi:hypothetical protein
MSTIVTRVGKGSPLTWTEVDSNFTNLNTDKLQSGDTAASLTITSATINGGTITGITDLAVADGGTGLSSLTAGYIPFGAGTSAFGSSANLFWDSANNRLGIGTTSPAYKLSLAGANVGLNVVETGSTYSMVLRGNSASSNIYDLKEPTANRVALSFDTSGQLISLWTANLERMRLDSNGNVGIGTSSPVGRLTITGTDFITSAISQIRTSVGQWNTLINASGTLTFRQGDITVAADYLNITSTGNVGIGTTTPTNKLTVIGGNGATLRLDNAGERYTQINFNNNSTNKAAITLDNTNSLLEHYCASGIFQTFWSNNAERMRIDSSGNVGIGTTSPEYKLDITAGSTQPFRVTTNNGTACRLRVTQTGQENWYIGMPASSQAFIFSSDATANIMSLLNTGNVGIGTTSPACVLDVVGGIQTSRTAVTSPAATDGNVFSGTYTPSLNNTTNIASSTAAVCQYMRVGNVVTVSGTVTIDPTATGRIVMGFSLPIASAIAGANEVGGTFASSGTTTVNVGSVTGDATNDRATFDGVTNDAASRVYGFSFTYRIL